MATKEARQSLRPTESNVPKYVEALISFVRTVKYERTIFAGRFKVPQTDRVLALLSAIPALLDDPDE